jgi:hypothetical protein
MSDLFEVREAVVHIFVLFGIIIINHCNFTCTSHLEHRAKSCPQFVDLDVSKLFILFFIRNH